METPEDLQALLADLKASLKEIAYKRSTGRAVNYDEYLGTDWVKDRPKTYRDYPGEARTFKPKRMLAAYTELMSAGKRIERTGSKAMKAMFKEVMDEATGMYTTVQRHAASDPVQQQHWGRGKGVTVERPGGRRTKPGMLSLSNPDGLINVLDEKGRNVANPLARGGSSPQQKITNTMLGANNFTDTATGNAVDFDANDYSEGGKRTAAGGADLSKARRTPMTDEARRIHNQYIKGKVTPEVDMSSHARHAERRFDWGRAEAGTSGDRTVTESAKGYKQVDPDTYRFRTNALEKEGERILKEIEPTIADNTAHKKAMGTADVRANDGKELPNYRVDDAKAKHKENLKDPLKLSEDRNKFLEKIKKLKRQGGFISPSLLKNVGKIGGITAASMALEHFVPNNPLSVSRRRGYKLWEEVGDLFGFDGNVDSNVAEVKNPYMRAGASVGQGLLVDTLMTAAGAGGILGDWISGSKIDSKKGKPMKNRFKKGMLE